MIAPARTLLVFFLGCGCGCGWMLQCLLQADRSSTKGQSLELTENANRAWKVLGTKGNPLVVFSCHVFLSTKALSTAMTFETQYSCPVTKVHRKFLQCFLTFYALPSEKPRDMTAGIVNKTYCIASSAFLSFHCGGEVFCVVTPICIESTNCFFCANIGWKNKIILKNLSAHFPSTNHLLIHLFI